MPVNILNLPGLSVLDFKETNTDYHVQAEPTVISRLCPHCGRSNETVNHAQKALFIWDMPSHGKSVAIHLNVSRLRCKPCNQTFTASVPEVDTARQMTERLVKWVGRQSPITFPVGDGFWLFFRTLPEIFSLEMTGPCGTVHY